MLLAVAPRAFDVLDAPHCVHVSNVKAIFRFYLGPGNSLHRDLRSFFINYVGYLYWFFLWNIRMLIYSSFFLISASCLLEKILFFFFYVSRYLFSSLFVFNMKT